MTFRIHEGIRLKGKKTNFFLTRLRPRRENPDRIWGLNPFRSKPQTARADVNVAPRRVRETGVRRSCGPRSSPRVSVDVRILLRRFPADC